MDEIEKYVIISVWWVVIVVLLWVEHKDIKEVWDELFKNKET